MSPEPASIPTKTPRRSLAIGGVVVCLSLGLIVVNGVWSRSSSEVQLKQLTTAAVLYQNETGASPGTIAYGAVASLWMETLINHYARVAKIRLCPDAPERSPLPSVTTDGDAATAWFWQGSGPTNYSGSYGINGWIYTYEGASDAIPEKPKYFLKESNISSPSKTPVFVDAVWPDRQ